MDVFNSTIIEFDIKTHSIKEVSIDELVINSHQEHKIYWIHSNLDQVEWFEQISKKLNLTDDVIELCKEEDIIPTIIDRDDSLTIQIQCLTSTAFTNNEVNFSNFIMHLTRKYCFTAATEPLPILKEFVDSYQKSIRYAKTPCFILFLMLDNSINDYAHILFNIELVTDQMDIRVRTAHKNIYNDIMDVKHELMKVKHYTIAIREILMRISGRNIAVISEQCKSSLYNLSNHSHMVIHEIDSIRDLLNALLDQIDNALMQKMSETMRVLTAFAAIFLPLSLITGIYGMNFEWIPELHWRYGYFFALGLIFFIGAMLLLVFKKMKWF